MKKSLLIIIAIIGFSFSLQAQKSLDAIFDKYADDDRFTYVSVGKGAMNLVKSLTGFTNLSADEKKLIQDVKSVKILTLESESTGNLGKHILADINKIIDAGNYEVIAEVRDKGERVNIYAENRKKEMLIVNSDDTAISLIWIK